VLELLAGGLALLSGCLLSHRLLRLQDRLEATVVGLGLSVALYLLILSGLLQAGVALSEAALGAGFISALLSSLALPLGRLETARPGSGMSHRERGLLLAGVGFVWLFTNTMQVITVDDDYWMHTPVQARMLRGVIPPTNPYFPDLVLGGHYGRDKLVVSTALLTGRDIFGAQLLLTSFCHSLSLAMLYLAIRRSSGVASATAGTFLAWFGMNVAHRVGLLDFYQNNGAPTYLLLSLLMLLFLELWRQPGFNLSVLCGLVLGVYAQMYETHFGLTILTILSLLPLLGPAARRSSLGALGLAVLLALLGGSALNRLAEPPPADQVIANQSQTVQLSFPKSPFLALRIQVGEIEPVSCGYRSGLGKALYALIDHTPRRSDPRYVRLWSWNVIRMHWVGLWLAPLSGWLLWRTRQRAGLFLWLFGLWGFLVPGMADFGPIHEFEWYRWEFAAGFGLAGALGVALGALVRTRRQAAMLALLLALSSQAGLTYLLRMLPQLNNPRPVEVLGLEFDSQAWLLRHSQQLQLQQADLRTLAWIRANPQAGQGCLLQTTGPPRPMGILFESTAMALADIEARGHRLPDMEEPIGVPPFRLQERFLEFLQNPGIAQGRSLGIDWLLLRSNEFELEQRLAENLPLVYYDNLTVDGKRRLLFQLSAVSLTAPENPLSEARFVSLAVGSAPAEARSSTLHFADGRGRQVSPQTRLPPLEQMNAAAPVQAQTAVIRFLDGTGNLCEQRSLPLSPAATGEGGAKIPPGE
jgi:hypothetical protein